MFGFLRVSVFSPEVKLADPEANAQTVVREVEAAHQAHQSQIYLFPELNLTGYTCGDLFRQQSLLEAAARGAVDIARQTRDLCVLIVVGLPIRQGGALYNGAAVIHRGKILGVIPKTYLPTYREFYERRWFAPAPGGPSRTCRLGIEEVRFGTDFLFQDQNSSAVIGIEICEDLWVPIPPSCRQALAGANVLLNLSASNETVGKSAYRRELVVNQSGRCVAGYVYAAAGRTESTTDLVFGGHCLVAENGTLLAESPKFQNATQLTVDLDLDKLNHERVALTSFVDGQPSLPEFETVKIQLESPPRTSLLREVPASPFVPASNAELKARCEEIFGIQTSGIAHRLQAARVQQVVIGVSGGLDSTLALLVTVKAFDQLGRSSKDILGLTLPGFGTTARTKQNAIQLMDVLGISKKTIDIRTTCLETFLEMGHAPLGVNLVSAGRGKPLGIAELEAALQQVPHDKQQDLVFENVQARTRTLFLMSHGFVIGTGDLSELALGWCTYNGDHMSMYNPNCSIPKTLVTFLVQYVADYEAKDLGDPQQQLAQTLRNIVGTPISPELLPPDKHGEIQQSTESVLGPYELHDFFLAHMMRYGASPKKIFWLAQQVHFKTKYTGHEIKKWLRVFYQRFFMHQFKRSCVPDGPKVGSVSLSPRGDWRMPSDATVALWLKEVDELDAKH